MRDILRPKKIVLFIMSIMLISISPVDAGILHLGRPFRRGS